MKKMNPMTLIAPCGMNCGICSGYLREKNRCGGCRSDDVLDACSIARCRIKNCESIRSGRIRYCFDCEMQTCRRLKDLDKRYRTRYGMSMMENLLNIRKNGIRKFAADEKRRWACPACGGTINVHRARCSLCGRTHEPKDRKA
jgi:hypothetical protein